VHGIEGRFTGAPALLWRPMPVSVYALVFVTISGLLAAAWAQPWVPVEDLLRDPLAVAQLASQCCHSYYGALSSLGVLLWAGTAAVCLFAGLLLFNLRGLSEDARFLGAAGLFSGLLAADDLFLLHDHVLPNYGVPDIATYSLYGLLCIGYLWSFRFVIAGQDFVAFLLACGFLAISILVDRVIHSDAPIRIFIEDGSKLFGIGLWAAFHVTAAVRLCLAAAPGSVGDRPAWRPAGRTAAEAVRTAERGTVLTLGNYRPTIAVARALDRHSYRVIVGSGGGEGGAEFSRHVREAWHHPDLERNEEAFSAALSNFLQRRPDIGFVFPITEEFVVWLARNREAVPKERVVVSALPRIVETCLDKPKMLELARVNGLGCPPFEIVRSYSELTIAAQRVEWPVVVRPLTPGRRIGSRKAVIAATAAELERMLPEWPAGQAGLLVQRKANGVRRNVYFAAHEGEIFSALETKILRTDRIDGTGLAVDGVTVPATAVLLDHCGRLARALEFTGIGLAQFILDAETGQSCFIEINPRIAGSHAITEAAGQDLSHVAIALSAGGSHPLGTRSFKAPPGLRYAWSYGDLRGLKSAVREKEIGFAGALRWLLRATETWLRADTHMTWRWSDPLPTLALFLRLLPGLRRFSALAPQAQCQRKQEII